jgi:hypothetical protein
MHKGFNLQIGMRWEYRHDCQSNLVGLGCFGLPKRISQDKRCFFLEKCILTSNIINGLLWSKPKGVEERLSSVIPPV